MRGEYSISDAELLEQLELPPRARRILRFNPNHIWVRGTTSACAENTRVKRPDGDVYRNYLRVRGEYTCDLPAVIGCGELPPRARRILLLDTSVYRITGTTSACAENTNSLTLSHP